MIYGHSMGTSAIPRVWWPLFYYQIVKPAPLPPWEDRYADFCRRLADKRDLTKEAGE